MKRRIFIGLLAIEAVVCVTLYAAQPSFADVFPTVMAFPFEQIGFGLRALSLSGGAGNVAAFVVYAALGLSPVATLFALRKKRRLCAEDLLLVLLSAILFAALYFMVNPGMIGVPVDGAAGQAIGKAIMGGVVYSVLCGYFVLRLLRLFFYSTNLKLARYMAFFLCLLCVVFVYIIFGACFGSLLDSVRGLQAGNTGMENMPGSGGAGFSAGYALLGLQFIIEALPYVLDVIVVFAALKLLDELRADRYSAEAVEAVGRMSKVCAAALIVTVLSNLGFNLFQLLLVKLPVGINITVEIPVLSIGFVLVALLLTRFVTENKQLKDDNDMFI